jgi:hypothetical protein
VRRQPREPLLLEERDEARARDHRERLARRDGLAALLLLADAAIRDGHVLLRVVLERGGAVRGLLRVERFGEREVAGLEERGVAVEDHEVLDEGLHGAPELVDTAAASMSSVWDARSGRMSSPVLTLPQNPFLDCRLGKVEHGLVVQDTMGEQLVGRLSGKRLGNAVMCIRKETNLMLDLLGSSRRYTRSRYVRRDWIRFCLGLQ